MVKVIKLKHDGENWSEWRESIQKIAERKRLANYLVGTPPEPFKGVFDSLTRRMIKCTVPKSISNHFRHYTTARECIDYLTKRFDKLCQSEHGKTTARKKNMEKVGEKGEKPHRRDDEAATASGPGTATTDHQKTDGGSLATPASSPVPRDDKVVLTGKPPVKSQPREGQSGAMSQVRTPPSENMSDRETQGVTGNKVKGGEMDEDKPCRAHERVDDKTTTTTAGAPRSTSLKGEYIPQASDDSTELIVRKPDEVKATWDQGFQPATSASASSTPRDHPDEDAGTENPPRPSEDLADTTGDEERHPDEPTKPPDKPKGTGGREGERRVESRESRASRGHTRCTEDDSIKTRRPAKPDDSPDNSPDEVEGTRVGDIETMLSRVPRVQGSPDEDGSDERRPGMADEPPDKAQVESRGPDSVQVEPESRRNGGVTHECADTGTDSSAEEAHGDVQDKAERSATCQNMLIKGERGSALAQGRSMTTDEENDQHNEASVDDVPSASPGPPPSFPTPDKPVQRPDEPPSAELEGERTHNVAIFSRVTRPPRPDNITMYAATP